MMSDVPAEFATDNLVKYLISNEDKECSTEDNPAQGEKDECYHEEETVTVGVRERVCKLNLEKKTNLFWSNNSYNKESCPLTS